jgi:glucose/arabinose dehydrogenase
VDHTFGKMLRVNRDGTIPTDNPYYNTNTGINRTVWSLGLRNPYTFAVQPGTGRMFINDVGQNTWEEINEGFAAANYGWPTTEGDFNPATFPNFTRPLYSYSHSIGGIAIAGGAFYNPDFVQFPTQYAGAYFFGDYGNGRIWSINPNTPPAANAAVQFASGANNLVDIDVAPDGTMYYLQRSTGTTNSGRIGRIQFTANLAPTIRAVGDVQRAGERRADAAVSVATQQPEHRRRDRAELHAAERPAERQRCDVSGGHHQPVRQHHQ